ncbi:MAG TPA: heavy metal translocating P-type ATPase [Pseudonocardiaceae bacterium]|nr:heavy metal translocating P-type ATPase [Pseudonocardiaceae bacterium]
MAEVVRPATPVRRTRVWALPEVRWATAATLLFALGLIAQFSAGPAWLYWTLYLACYASGGWEPGWAGLSALRQKTLDVDLLMVVAAIGAAAIGQVTDGGLLIVIFATSGALEALATRRTADSVRGLLDLAPQQATRTTDHDTEETVDTEQLRVDDHILVRPGERIGADGTVLDGASEVDEATITGEPLPAPKKPGSEVFAGTLNGTGALRVRVTRAAGDSVVARIVALVERASQTKAPTQLFIERIEQRYSVGIVVATLALFALPLLFGTPLQTTLLRAMTFMIVASPCAVVLATMPPLLAAMANAGRHGVLVKSAIVMEQLGLTERVAFDKTGTLTEGRPRVARIAPEPESTEEELLSLAAAAELNSEHPLGRAILAEARHRKLILPHANDFRAIPGVGVEATVDGRRVEVGRGRNAVEVRVDGTRVGQLELTDRVRDAAAAAIGQVRTVTPAEPVLLTGDNVETARKIAATVGIEQVHAGLLPAQKAQITAEHRTTMVGDGVNDAPALAAAHLGIAMGRGGADLALETADAVLVHDDLAAIPSVLALSRRARRLVRANLVIAATVITGLVCWDLFGHLPLPLGVAGHEGSTVLVGLNGLRLLRSSAWPTRRA